MKRLLFLEIISGLQYTNVNCDILINKKDEKPYRKSEYHGEYHVKGANAGYVLQKAGFEDVAECHFVFLLLYPYFYCSCMKISFILRAFIITSNHYVCYPYILH